VPTIQKLLNSITRRIKRPTTNSQLSLHDDHLRHAVLAVLYLGCKCWTQVVALVGPSGGGKSSIVKLVERFYLPSAGAVRMDGRDVGVYGEKWLRRRVAIVSQEPTLYARRSAADPLNFIFPWLSLQTQLAL